MLTQLIFTFCLNLVMSGTLQMMWNIFNTLQLITALPLLNVSPPGNVISVQESFDKIVNFEMIEKDTIYSWVVSPLVEAARDLEKVVVEEEEIDDDPKR
jgi:hypothetical protein